MESSQIKRLSPELTNQLKAGEVLHHPTGAVRELVDNALDAGASRIEVHLENGGLDLIRVIDNGCGIPADELTLAIEAHSTSKLRESLEELVSLETLGFRGEALPAIGAVSTLTLASKPPGALSGRQVVVEQGVLTSESDVGMIAGTSATVVGLFKGTPREAFLRKPSSETSNIRASLRRVALAHPKVRLILKVDGKTSLEFAPQQNLKDRCLEVLDREVYDALVEVDGEHRGVRVHGYVTRPPFQVRSASKIYCFVGGRYISNPTILKAINDALALPMKRYPATILHLGLEPNDVDINLKPDKTEILFRDTSSIYLAVRSALSQALSSRPTSSRETEGAVSNTGSSASVLQPYQRDLTLQSEHPTAPSVEKVVPSAKAATMPAERIVPTPRSSQTVPKPSSPVSTSQSQPAPEPPSSLAYAATIGGRYLLCHDERGIVVIDRYAAQVAVLHQQLEQALGTSTTRAQRLPSTTIVSLGLKGEKRAAYLDFLTSLGFDPEEFGSGSLRIQMVPRGVEPNRLEQLVVAGADWVAGHPSQDVRGCLQDLVDAAFEPGAHEMELHDVEELLRGLASLPMETQTQIQRTRGLHQLQQWFDA